MIGGSSYTITAISILKDDILCTLSDLNSHKAYVLNVVHHIAHESHASVLTLSRQTLSSLPINIYLSFLLEIRLRGDHFCPETPRHPFLGNTRVVQEAQARQARPKIALR